MDNGSTASYVYNALGQRVEKQAGTVYTEYFYDASGEPVGENNRTSWTLSVVPLGGRHLAHYQSGATYFTHPSYLGSTSQVTDYTGGVAQDQLFYPWGQAWAMAGSAIETRFASLQHRDSETSLDPTPSRAYSSRLDRWMTSDPGGLKAVHMGDPQTWNMYAYVRNNPTTLTDPSGLDVYLANDTEEGRKRAWARLARNLNEKEASNIAYRQNKEGKYELFVKDSSAVNLSKASAGYKDLIGLINERSIMANYGLVGGGLSATFASLGTVTSYGAGGLTTQPEGKSVDVLVQQGNLLGGVKVFAPSGGETTGIQPDYLTAAHELFGETLKYRAGHESLQNDPLQDSRTVIGIENDIRRFLGFPLRTGSDHGIPVIVVEP